MTQTTVRSGAVKNNGGTILNAGNSTATRTNNLTIRNSVYRSVMGSHPFLAVSAASSGNLGTRKINTSGVFGKLTEGDRKSTRLNSSHEFVSRMPSSA